MNLFDALNQSCGAIIFVYCACALGGKEWARWNVEFWANTLLLASAVAIFVTPFPSLEALVFRVGVAAHFAAKTWAIWRQQKRKIHVKLVRK